MAPMVEELHHAWAAYCQNSRICRKQSAMALPSATSPLKIKDPQPIPYFPPLLHITFLQTHALHVALQGYTLTEPTTSSTNPQDSKQFVIDTGASITIVNSKDDFVSENEPTQGREIKGIASGLAVYGIRTILLCLQVDDNTIQEHLPQCLYVPECPVRLLCPCQVAAHTGHQHDGFNTLADNGFLTCRGSTIQIPYDNSAGLPILSPIGDIKRFLNYCTTLCAYNATTPQQTTSPVVNLKHNLSTQQWIKLILHECCNHKHMRMINDWTIYLAR